MKEEEVNGPIELISGNIDSEDKNEDDDVWNFFL